MKEKKKKKKSVALPSAMNMALGKGSSFCQVSG
jgi:hypothetical protein